MTSVNRALGLLFAVALLIPMPAFGQAPSPCKSEHIVRPGDSLLKIAEEYYGDRSVYQSIVKATNEQAALDSAFAKIENPSKIRTGWRLCLPEINGKMPRQTAEAGLPTEIPQRDAAEVEKEALATPETPAPISQTAQKHLSGKLTPEAIAFDASFLARSIAGATAPASPYDASSPPGPSGNPEYAAFLFDGVERLRVFPVKAYTSLWDAANDPTVSNNISQLQNILANRPRLPENPLPFLPPATGYNDLAVQMQFLDFIGGSGLRFVGRFSQSVSPVVNADLKYVFQGLTDDGEYYISFDYPVSAAVLPDTLDDVPPADGRRAAEDFQSYLAGIQAQLNGLDAADFTPDLRQLDAVVESLKVSAPLPVQASQDTLSGITWRLKEIQETSEKTITIDDPEKYTLEFMPGGKVAIRADCNYGRGAYEVQGQQLTIDINTLTKAMCPLDSLSEMYVRLLNEATSYVMLDGELFISYGIDGGILKFVSL